VGLRSLCPQRADFGDAVARIEEPQQRRAARCDLRIGQLPRTASAVTPPRGTSESESGAPVFCVCRTASARLARVSASARDRRRPTR
jgi:hypothetical protein